MNSVQFEEPRKKLKIRALFQLEQAKNNWIKTIKYYKQELKDIPIYKYSGIISLDFILNKLQQVEEVIDNIESNYEVSLDNLLYSKEFARDSYMESILIHGDIYNLVEELRNETKKVDIKRENLLNVRDIIIQQIEQFQYLSKKLKKIMHSMFQKLEISDNDLNYEPYHDFLFDIEVVIHSNIKILEGTAYSYNNETADIFLDHNVEDNKRLLKEFSEKIEEIENN